MKRAIAILAAVVVMLSTPASGVSATLRPRDLQPLCDSLSVELEQYMKVRMNPEQRLKVTRIVSHGSTLDLYFTQELSYYPWHSGDAAWFKGRLSSLLPQYAPGYRPGRIISNRYEISEDSELILPVMGNDGRPSEYTHSIEDPRWTGGRLVTRVGEPRWTGGMDGRHIALWQSHGLYYDAGRGVWQWQRANLHRTVEDLLSPSFVLPYLIPMLENAGAYVMTPRERDLQPIEIICDNDPAFKGERSGLMRRSGHYREHGNWKEEELGFADFKAAYTFNDNPFTAGTARSAECSERGDAQAIWTPVFGQRGSYAVYVSYKTLPNSCGSAHYSVEHLGGTTEFLVDQRRGGGTWIYLGTFEFPEGRSCSITLSNLGPEGQTVTADAVKIGGGMGKLERGGSTSGVPAALEGAHYWMQWAGTDKSITQNWDNDYTNDFATRGAWTVMMREKKNIPIDLALAFHTDAGLAQADSIIGTLAIYTLRNEGEREFSDGRDRIISRLLCDWVQTQVVSDLREEFDPDWTRRGLWDRSYSECRTAGVPAMILELLSHQNLADMKHALDPAFRFTVSRAVYKGILKTLSEYYGSPYVVQPLPVHDFSCTLVSGSRVRLEWQPTYDEKEPTAAPEGYIIYVRRDDGAFDASRMVSGTSADIDIEEGSVYSFRVEAYNNGGRSFPSETLSAGVPSGADLSRTVLIVNNFDRVSAPAWTDSESYAGFTASADSGVPYLYDISYTGENYEFDRSAEFVSNDYPGFGASYGDYTGLKLAGNSFDYPGVHGRTLLDLGYPFHSMSAASFRTSGAPAGTWALDVISGKQKTTVIGRGAVPEKYSVFPDEMRTALKNAADSGCNIFISGSNIASDGGKATAEFTSSVLGYKLATPNGSSAGLVEGMHFSHTPNPDVYCVESPDGIDPAGRTAAIWLRYPGRPYAAGVFNEGANCRTAALAVPLETFTEESDRSRIMGEVMEFFSR